MFYPVNRFVSVPRTGENSVIISSNCPSRGDFNDETFPVTYRIYFRSVCNNVAVDRVVASVVQCRLNIDIFSTPTPKRLSERERPGRRFTAGNSASARSHVGADCRTVTIGVEKLQNVSSDISAGSRKRLRVVSGHTYVTIFVWPVRAPPSTVPQLPSSKALACVYAVIFFFFFFNRYTSPVLLSYRSIFARYGSPSPRTKR